MFFIRFVVKWTYFLIIASLHIVYFLLLVNHTSFLYYYYQVLSAFHWSFSLLYGLNIISGLLNLLAVLVVFMRFTYRRWGPPRVWMSLFFLGLVFNFWGRNYEFLMFKSFYNSDWRQFRDFLYLWAFLVLSPYLYWVEYLQSYRPKPPQVL